MLPSNISNTIQQIDDVQILKEKILKIDSIFTLVAEKQRKLTDLEVKYKKLQTENNKLEGRNNELVSEIDHLQKQNEHLVDKYQGQLLEESQKYSMLEERIKIIRIKHNEYCIKNKKNISRYKQHWIKKSLKYKKRVDKKYLVQICSLRKTIKFLRSKCKTRNGTERSNKAIVVLENILIKSGNKEQEKENGYDIDFLLNEMIVMPDLVSPFEAEILHRSTHSQTTRTSVTRPVQTDSLSTSQKETQTFNRSSNISIQCNLDEKQSKLVNKSTQTELNQGIKFTQTNNPSEKKITLKQAVVVLKKSRQNFTITNGILTHYSKTATSNQSTNESLIAQSVFRRLAKYIDTHYSTIDSRKRRGKSNILREIKQLERSRALMQIRKSGFARCIATSDTESSGYESRLVNRFDDVLSAGKSTPSEDSAIWSEAELQQNQHVEDVTGMIDEMIVDFPNVISPINQPIEDAEIIDEVVENEPALVEITSKERKKTKPKNRLAMLKKGIKKCNQISVPRRYGVAETANVAKESEEMIVSKKSRKGLATTKNVPPLNDDKPLLQRNETQVLDEHSYARNNEFDANKTPISISQENIENNRLSILNDASTQFDTSTPFSGPNTNQQKDISNNCKSPNSSNPEEQEASLVVIETNEMTTRSGRVIKSPVMRSSPSRKKQDKCINENISSISVVKRKRGRPRKAELDTPKKDENEMSLNCQKNADEEQLPPENEEKSEKSNTSTIESLNYPTITQNLTSSTNNAIEKVPRSTPCLKAEDILALLDNSGEKTEIENSFSPVPKRKRDGSNTPKKDENVMSLNCQKHVGKEQFPPELENEEKPKPYNTSTLESSICSTIPQNLTSSPNDAIEKVARSKPCLNTEDILAVVDNSGEKSEREKSFSPVPNASLVRDQYNILENPNVGLISSEMKTENINVNELTTRSGNQYSFPNSIQIKTKENSNQVIDPLKQNCDLTKVSKTEELKINIIHNQSGQHYNSPTYTKTAEITTKESSLNENKDICTLPKICDQSEGHEVKEETTEDTTYVQLKLTFKQTKQLLDKCVWSRGDKTVCQEEVQQLKEMNIYKLVNFIIQYLKHDRGEIEIQPPSLTTTSMEPHLTIKQKVIIGLMIRIERELNSKSYISQLISCTEKHLLFNQQCPPEAIENLSRFYTALCRLQQAKRRVRVFLADVLYHSPVHKFIIIFTIVKSWLHVLQPYRDITTDAGFEHVLAHITMSQPNEPTASGHNVIFEHDNCIGVMKNLLISYFKFPRELPNIDDTMMALLEVYICGGEVHQKVAILVLCVHNSAEWTYGKAQLIAEVCKVGTDAEVARNLFQLIGDIAKKIDKTFAPKVYQLLAELFSYLTTNKLMELGDLKPLCLDNNASNSKLNPGI